MLRLFTLLLIVTLMTGCGDTGCEYEDFTHIERGANSEIANMLVVTKYCTRERCPGLPDRITCRVN